MQVSLNKTGSFFASLRFVQRQTMSDKKLSTKFKKLFVVIFITVVITGFVNGSTNDMSL